MTDAVDTEQQSQLVIHVLRRLRPASIAANLAGAVVVFLFLSFVLPEPGLRHPWALVAVNGGLLVLSGAVGVPVASAVLGRMWRARLSWALGGTTPTARESELTLRYPLPQHSM